MPFDTQSDRKLIITYIEHHWIQPKAGSAEILLDEEDQARAALIRDLQEIFSVNDEAVPIILDLVDQIHRMRFLVRKSVQGEKP